ncbi:ATP-binding sensor histidine kinase [Nostoc sp. FACHB-110]|uniref:trifunctional serine/threonine-protein kinase/ATP-binding protein/sensor histidine kinase n=1 Tax=Nostoc sp. FACHB-110 TaxID=2692834 RepID=UPI001685B8FF|nr:ATP-binding sensor histidine kinase [Nostoc sp. FACHB-110]MBD2440366.1 AAA family ATPase [Nostoc sp. FACHB-110]
MVSILNIHLPGYSIQEQIYSGTRTLVYRGVREQDQKPVVIKLMRLEYPSFHELLQFRNQYVITKNLQLTGVIQPYSLETYHNGYALVMEDFGGISLKQWGIEQGNTQSLINFLQVAIAIADILNQLHSDAGNGQRLRVIHKDIKPANILINPQTKQVKLIDFSIASLLQREIQEVQSPNVLEGTLAYLSPEQTGRMNRGVDYRTDFYSLGVTLYEMLTGELPFHSEDPMELVHGHLAKQVTPPHQINPDIPVVISQIITKLMAKNAEERYQSASGLKHDLETCLHYCKKTGEIPFFAICQRDIQDHFMIPEKLYGREKEVQTLLEAFDRVANGASELMLVSGFSGIGKTAVVNEVHKPIVKQRGYFIKGKFDQFNRNIPFSAFVQAFRSLMRQLLTESDVAIKQWKSKIIAALGEDAQVIVEVIPELELIIGQQAPVPELSGSAAQNRFNLLLQNFIQVFTNKEYPLVVFLDDLQWADSASLSLIQLLINESNNSYLLLIGAYRDNEVIPAHPLMVTLEEIINSGAIINTINLQKLSYLKLNQLVADTLSCTEELAWSLSQLVYQKTQGNPFFTTQFLKALHQDGLIEFNYVERCWQCDITQINQQALTDDVLEFMAFQLQKLPQSTQQVLKLAACIGNQFDLKILAIVAQQSEIETAVCLWNALQEGLILPQSDIYKFYLGEINQAVQQDTSEVVTYKFLHDRVQQAAYSLIPEVDRAIAHYQIGQLLLQQMSPDVREERIFELVNQLNYGIDLVVDQQERDDLAQLNLSAGRKARSATAFQAANEYARVGLRLLGAEAWQRQYQITLALHELAAEIAFLCSDFEQMQQRITAVIDCAKTPLEKVQVYQVQIQAFNSRNQFGEAIATGKSVLQLLGVSLPDCPTSDDIEQARQEINSLIGDRTIAELFDLPTMTNVEKLAVMQIAASILPACYMTNSPIYPLVVALQVKLSIQFGNNLFSPFSYASYAFQVKIIWQDMAQVQQFGQLAYRLVLEPNAKSQRPTTFVVFAGYVHHCSAPLKETLPMFQAGYQAGLETGNWEFLVYNVQVFALNAFWSGQPLTELEGQIRAYDQHLHDLKQVTTGKHYLIYWEAARILLGESEDEVTLRQETYEADLLSDVQTSNDLFRLCIFYLHRFFLNFLLGDINQAQQDSDRTRQHLAACVGTVIEPVFYFFDSLTALAKDAKSTLARVQANQAQLKQWSDYAPMNHLHKYQLVEAERYRVRGDYQQAMDLYDLAIAGAKENGYLQEESLANELAAQLYLDWGKEKVAQAYMQEAYYCYARWGALAKIHDLEQRYPQLLQPIFQQRQFSLHPLETMTNMGLTLSASSHRTSSSRNNSISDALDFTSILKTAQAISRTIELDQLIVILTRIILENSGAKKTVLILPQGETWLIRAITYINHEAISRCEIKTILEKQPVETCPEIPKQIIYYVKNTKETVIIDNLQTNIPGLIGEYMQSVQPKSVLCLPILNQGHLVGILYLENRLTQGVFNSDRLIILDFLCIQAGIALENAQLYTDLQASKVLLQKLANNIPGVIYQLHLTTDGTASIPYVSSGCYHLYGITAEELMYGKYSLRTLEHPDDVATIDQLMLESAQNLSTFEHEWRIITPKGQLKWIQAVSQPEAQTDGSIIWDGVVLDITERKQAEAAVQQKSQELEQALHNLQQAQLKIVQSEKMSALGNLVAGVAHEINNPTGFISGNIQPAYEGVQDLFNLLQLYQEKFPEPGEEIEAEIETIDLEYLQSDLPKLISSMKEGVQRIQDISNSLRTFSRADTQNKVSFNIHEGLDSTILILKHRLKANEQHPAIEIRKNYSHVPAIECFPGQLNQVFMNLLANAIDALEESNIGRSFAEIKANPNLITISTKLTEDGKHVSISIKDNGKGMTQEVKAKIFDHLYTTKMVGKGTGLGLAIAQAIVVEKHGGTIEVNSAPMQGAEFIITLPR